MSKSKPILFFISICYLSLILYIFLTNAGFDALLVLAIFSYLFYTPFLPIFNYDIDDIFIMDCENMDRYLKIVVLTMAMVAVLYFTGLLSSDATKYVLNKLTGMIPHGGFDTVIDMFNFVFIKPFEEGNIIMMAGVILVCVFAWPMVLAMFIFVIGFILIWYLFGAIFTIVIMLVFLAAITAVLIGFLLIIIQTRKFNKDYITSPIEGAKLIVSTAISGIYLIFVFYANMFTLG